MRSLERRWHSKEPPGYVAPNIGRIGLGDASEPAWGTDQFIRHGEGTGESASL